MDFAIIQTGGKQYKVAPGQKLKIEKLDGEKDEKITFDRVLLTSRGGDLAIGVPHVSGATVEAKVLRQARAKKVIIFKYHSKARVRKHRGHRQYFTEVEITKV